MLLLLLTHARAAAPATLRRALPVFAALALVGMVFFGKQAVTAHDVTSLADANPLGRAGLWLLWLLPLAPAAHALLDPPGLTYLRTLPIAPARLWAVSA